MLSLQNFQTNPLMYQHYIFAFPILQQAIGISNNTGGGWCIWSVAKLIQQILKRLTVKCTFTAEFLNQASALLRFLKISSGALINVPSEMAQS